MRISPTHLRNDVLYRHYGPKERPCRLGGGTYYRTTEPLRWTRDIDTEDFSASLILAGRLHYHLDDGRECILGVGDFYQRIPGLIHSTAPLPPEPYSEAFLHLPGDVFRKLHAIGIIELIPYVQQVGDRPLLRAFHQIRQRVALPSATWHLEALLAMQEVLVLFRQNRERLSRIGKDRLLRAEELLKEFGQRTLPQIAEEVNMSYDSFRHAFKERTGLTPGKYRMRERIQQAMDLLLQTDRTAADIAAQLGYPDRYSFSKQFKQITGHTPVGYRKLVFKQNEGAIPPPQ